MLRGVDRLWHLHRHLRHVRRFQANIPDIREVESALDAVRYQQRALLIQGMEYVALKAGKDESAMQQAMEIVESNSFLVTRAVIHAERFYERAILLELRARRRGQG